MRYTKQTGVQGAWVKNAEIKSGTVAQLVSETEPVEGQFGKRDVAKIRIEGDRDVKNVNVNKPSISALVDAFGEDSKGWVDKPLTLHTEKMLVGGKRVTALYLVPEGYELSEDAGGYLVITKIEGEKQINQPDESIPIVEDDPNDIAVEDIPF